MAHALSDLEDLFPTIFAKFPTLRYSKPQSFNRPWVFWTHAADNPDTSKLQERLRHAFSDLVIGSLDGLIQFWAPVRIGNNRFLKTFGQPFAIANPDEATMKYMLRSLNHGYNASIDDNEEVSIAFRNNAPELIMDLRVLEVSPMRNRALECRLRCSVMLPVFYPHDQRYCVGVVECCTKQPYDLFAYLVKVNAALEKEGFKTFNVQNHMPYKSIRSLEQVRDEIDLALAVILEGYNIGFAQVWISCKDVPNVSSGMKLIGRRCGLPNDEFPYHVELDWYDEIYDNLFLKMGKGLAGKTLDNHQPYFIENISKLGNDDPLRFIHDSAQYSCFVICLRSKRTNNLDYAFEFLWHQDINCNTLFGSLVLALKSYLPDFRYASGGKLGDELCINLHVDNSYTRSKVESFKIFERNKRYPSLQFSEKRKGPVVVKQRSSREPQSVQNVEVSLRKRYDTRATPDSLIISGDKETILTIKAQDLNGAITFDLPISYATFVGIKLKLAKRFNLNPLGYNLKYFDEDGHWILMCSDEDMRRCIKAQTALNSTKIRLLCQI